MSGVNVEITRGSGAKCGREQEFSDDYSVHLQGLMSKEEFTECVEAFNARIRNNKSRAFGVSLYLILSILPWLLVIPFYGNPDMLGLTIGLPLASQLIVMVVFLIWMRKRRRRFNQVLKDTCAILNEIYGERGLNFRMKYSEDHNRNGGPATITLEVFRPVPAVQLQTPNQVVQVQQQPVQQGVVQQQQQQQQLQFIEQQRTMQAIQQQRAMHQQQLVLQQQQALRNQQLKQQQMWDQQQQQQQQQRQQSQQQFHQQVQQVQRNPYAPMPNSIYPSTEEEAVPLLDFKSEL